MNYADTIEALYSTNTILCTLHNAQCTKQILWKLCMVLIQYYEHYNINYADTMEALFNTNALCTMHMAQCTMQILYKLCIVLIQYYAYFTMEALFSSITILCILYYVICQYYGMPV